MDDGLLTTELSSEERGALGKLQWPSSQTRSYLSFEADSLASDLETAT